MTYYLYSEKEYNLDDYKFAEVDKTVLEKLLNPTYDYLTSLLPKSLAPNAITMIGFILSAISALLYIYYCPNFVENVPSWVLYYGGIATILYHLCDYIDGKQARRIGASSPLGELMDHGIDCVNLILIFISSAICGHFSPFHSMLIFIQANHIFSCAHLGVYQTGIRVDNNGYVGVLEVTIYIALNHILVGYLGHSSVDIIVYNNYKISDIYILLQYIVQIYSLSTAIHVIFFLENEIPKNRVGNKDLSFKGRCKRTIPFYISTALYLMMAYGRNSLFLDHPLLYYFMIGAHYALLTNKLILYHTMRKHFSMAQYEIIYMVVIVVNQYFLFVDHLLLLYVICFLMYVNLSLFIIMAVHDLSVRLNVNIFTVGKKNSKSN